MWRFESAGGEYGGVVRIHEGDRGMVPSRILWKAGKPPHMMVVRQRWVSAIACVRNSAAALCECLTPSTLIGESGCCAGRSLKATEQLPQMQRVPDPSHTIAPNARGSTTLQSRNRPPGKKPMMSKRCGPPVFSTHRQGKSRSAASKERQIMGTDQKGGGSSSITR